MGQDCCPRNEGWFTAAFSARFGGSRLLSTLWEAARQVIREGRSARLGEESRRLRLDPAHREHLLDYTAALLTRNAVDLEDENRGLRQRLLELESQATTDPLTGLLNRRAIEAVVEDELTRRARESGPLTVGVVDADHFKAVNSRFLLLRWRPCRLGWVGRGPGWFPAGD